jgi:anti-sigma regulatory factor (Ser/Thr protein kinase)
MTGIERKPRNPSGFRHWALAYRGESGFLDGVLPFIRRGIEAGEPTLVMVSPEKIERLREAIGDPDCVQFADMDHVGANPARIIPAWRQFVEQHADRERPLRGIGEPISAARTAPELVECQRHEALLNLAFADAGDFDLLCPYDSEALDSEVMAEAERSHPVLVEGGRQRASEHYRGLEAIAAPFDGPLPEPPSHAPELAFEAETLGELRAFIRRHGREAHADAQAIDNLVTGVSELAGNSVRHGGGDGVARLWREDDVLICEIRDRGKMSAPLAGRIKPPAWDLRGRGLWLANQVCDLIQIRSLPGGTRTRAHVAIA